MNSNPLVSIIVNCFNGEKYLKEALQSIINQTYENWEVIFWDNKSQDDSKKIFLNFKENRFRYFFSERHVPLYKARNQAIKKSKGELIAFLDTDDWWERDKLEKQISFFKDEKVGLVYSNCYLFYEANGKRKLFKKKYLKSGYITKNLLKSYDVGILTILVRRTAYDLADGFNDTYSIIGDFDLVIRLSCKWKIACLQESLAYYRIHSSNFSFTSSSLEIKELEDWISDKKNYLEDNIKPYLYLTNERILFLKTINLIKENFFFNAIKNIMIYPINFNKLKLLFYLILPKKILDKVRSIR